jgi:hypothetical protein
VVEVRFVDPNRPPLRALETECKFVEGEDVVRPIEINGRFVRHFVAGQKSRVPSSA